MLIGDCCRHSYRKICHVFVTCMLNLHIYKQGQQNLAPTMEVEIHVDETIYQKKNQNAPKPATLGLTAREKIPLDVGYHKMYKIVTLCCKLIL